MRKTFAPIDDALIEHLFQPVSDFISGRTGFDRRGSACFCIDIASVAWIVSRASDWSRAVLAWDAATAIPGALLLLLGLVALLSLRTLFRRVSRRDGNPLRLAMQPHRAVVLLMLVARLAQLRAPGLADAADVVMLMFAASALYLGACAERPPVRRHSGALVSAA